MPLLFLHPLYSDGNFRRFSFAMRGAALSAACLLFCAPTVLAASLQSHRKSELAYMHAEQVLRRLEAKPRAERTRMDYERALNAYRAVYHGDPASPDAARSIASTAYLLASAGRRFHQKKLSHDAVQQWEFLRRQYPTSPLRKRALFEEAQLERFDLHDPAAAKKMYRSFVSHYPHDPLAVDARAALDGHPVQEEAGEQPDEPGTQEPGTQTRNTEAGTQSSRTPSTRKTTERAMKKSPAVEQPARADFSRQPDGVRASQKMLLPKATTSANSLPKATIQNVRYWAEGKSTRLVVDMSDPVPYRIYSGENKKKITLIFFGARSGMAASNPSIAAAQDANLSSLHIGMLSSDQTALVLQLKHPVGLSSFVLSHPSRLILDLKPRSAAEVARSEAHSTSHEVAAAATPKPAKPAAAKISAKEEAVAGVKNPASSVDPAQTSRDIAPAQTTSIDSDTGSQQSMTRVLGLRVRRIVIDAGHGGHDSGTIGRDGLEEKDVALGVALRLGHLLRQRLGAEVIYTRQSDKYVSLEKRTEIANEAHADLFLSIHANSSSDPKVRGVETYFLNFTSSPDAMAVAARENADSNRSEHELSTLVRKIALSDKIDESREFANDVQQELYEGMAPGNPGLKNRGVKQAPFVVLIGARMPSILTEISFLTNSESDVELRQPAYRERLAEALYRGVAEYVQGMQGTSGVRVAKTMAAEAIPDPAE